MLHGKKLIALDRWQAQACFWGSFGVPAYEENSVPTGENHPAFPYITYRAAVGGFNASISVTASVWTRSTSWAQADMLSDQIEKRLTEHAPYVIRTDSGILWVTAENHFAQNMGDPDDNMIKRKLISVALRYA